MLGRGGRALLVAAACGALIWSIWGSSPAAAGLERTDSAERGHAAALEVDRSPPLARSLAASPAIGAESAEVRGLEIVQRGSLRGRLVDAAGAASGGTFVRMGRVGAGSAGESWAGRTGPDGAFHAYDLPAGEWEVWAEVRGLWAAASAYVGSVEIAAGATLQKELMLGERSVLLDLRVLPEDVFADDEEDGGQTGWDLRLVPADAGAGPPRTARVFFGDGEQRRQGLERMMAFAAVQGLDGFDAGDRELVGRAQAGELDLDVSGEPVWFPGLVPGPYVLELDIGLLRHPVSGELVPAIVELPLDLVGPPTGPVPITIHWWEEIANARRRLIAEVEAGSEGDR